MLNILIVFFSVYALALGIVIFIGFLMQRNKEEGFRSDDNHLDLSEIVVLIPFRNEEHRLDVILESIQASKSYPKEFVFINDHSDDGSVKVIEEAKLCCEYRIINLPNSITGKKKALRYALEKTQSDFVLQLDADVSFHEHYFDELAKLDSADMYLMPAIMKAENFMEHLFEIDLTLVNAANVGVSGLKRPIMASGANMLFKRSSFDEVDNLESHKHAASGDDMYLLRDFRENDKEVRLISSLKNAIYTETPQSLKEFIDQRLRWLGKTGDLKDHLSTSLAIMQSILTLTFLALIVFTLVIRDWQLLVVVYGVKSILDMILFFPYFNRIKRLMTWCFIPFYELLFPFYTIVMLSLIYTYKPKWKGREIYTKS